MSTTITAGTIQIPRINAMKWIFTCSEVILFEWPPTCKNSICIIDHIICTTPGTSAIQTFIKFIPFKICVPGYHIAGIFRVVIPIDTDLTLSRFRMNRGFGWWCKTLVPWIIHDLSKPGVIDKIFLCLAKNNTKRKRDLTPDRKIKWCTAHDQHTIQAQRLTEIDRLFLQPDHWIKVGV